MFFGTKKNLHSSSKFRKNTQKRTIYKSNQANNTGQSEQNQFMKTTDTQDRPIMLRQYKSPNLANQKPNCRNIII